MKTFMLLTGSGAMVILTSYETVTAPGLVRTLRSRGISKFVAFDIPVELARTRYGSHLFVVEHNLRESGDLRVLDDNGDRALARFRFDEIGEPIFYDAGDNAQG